MHTHISSHIYSEKKLPSKNQKGRLVTNCGVHKPSYTRSITSSLIDTTKIEEIEASHPISPNPVFPQVSPRYDPVSPSTHLSDRTDPSQTPMSDTIENYIPFTQVWVCKSFKID